MKTHHKKRETHHRDEPNAASSRKSPDGTLVVEERIRLRAYEIHESRGGAPGRKLDDWLQAQREFTSGAA